MVSGIYEAIAAQLRVFADLGVRHHTITFRPGSNQRTTEQFSRVLVLL